MNELDEEKRIRLTLQVWRFWKATWAEALCGDNVWDSDSWSLQIVFCLISDGDSANEEAHVEMRTQYKKSAFVHHCSPFEEPPWYKILLNVYKWGGFAEHYCI